ncbi:AAA family ATPase [Agathobaculum massiliense]|uniref:AAA family ATPase n=1 Tax=Agathobaculum massiliense TaxID=3014267 RepID=UPI000D1EF969|nr:AAA family ATPase [Agathobaculum massiliense]
MNSKISSEITRIDLQEASYKDTGCHIEPTFVNFFFGNNGTGKSTIAKAILSGVGVTYASGRTAANYLPLVYNQDFIDANFRSYRNMKGVFTLNAKNVKAQRQIDEKNEERIAARRALTTATEKQMERVATQEKLKKAFYKECWDREKAFREEFAKTQSGKGKSEPFTREILKHIPKQIDLEEFRRLYDSAFSETAKRYQRFSTIADTAIMDTIAGSDILTVAIVNSADTELAGFLRNIGATEWMRQGHDLYAHNANGKCPYCGRNLSEDFEQIVIDSFDTRYQTNLQKLIDFLEVYRKTANTLFIPLQNIPKDVYPQIDVKPYTEKLEVLKAAIQENIEKIKIKTENPALPVILSDIAPILEELVFIINRFNALIEANNAIVDAGPKKRTECTEQAFSLLAFRLRDVIVAYQQSDAQIEAELATLNSEIEAQKKSLEGIERTLKSLRGQTVETETAKESINTMLRDSGLQGFSLQPKAGVDHVYEVRRPDGSIADNLSEGEKNFIAFLYFYHLVYGSDSAEDETRDKIVVIDDPVSSMDSGSLFIVSTLVRQMIEICRNNADNRNRIVDGNFIKQIFILTHNAYFHREITYGYISKYEYVSYYLIRKLDSKSTIKLCDDVNPNIPTERMNVNPVKNSYAALWDEYKEIQSAVPLMNVIRRILEYYFLQLCGYEGTSLRQVVLVRGKAEGKFKDMDGNDDEEKFQLASSMLAYINASSIGMNEGIDYVEECLDATECRNIFEMIFESMNQKQHYDMMMGIH